MARKTTRKKTLDRVQLPPLDLAQRYTIPEALAYLRISRSRFYQNVEVGAIKTVKDGTRCFVPGAEIARLSRPPEVA
jgi:hypothetical protein